MKAYMPLNIDSADLTSKIIISLLVHHFEHVLSLAVGVLPQHLVCLPDYAATKCLIPSSHHPHIFYLFSSFLTYLFISPASMCPLPSVSYMRNISRSFSSALPLDVKWITWCQVSGVRCQVSGARWLTITKSRKSIVFPFLLKAPKAFERISWASPELNTWRKL